MADTNTNVPAFEAQAQAEPAASPHGDAETETGASQHDDASQARANDPQGGEVSVPSEATPMETGEGDKVNDDDVAKEAAGQSAVEVAAAGEGDDASSKKLESVEKEEKSGDIDTENVNFELPQSIVSKIVKSTLGDKTALSKDAGLAFSKAAGIFILYLTSVANDFCKQSKRSTLMPEHVLAALEEIEMDEMLEPIKAFRDKLQAERKQKAVSKKEKTEREAAASPAAAGEAGP